MATERPVPSERNNTLSPDQVRRKSFEELRDTAFSTDQIRVLEEWISGGGGGGSVVGWNQKVSDGVNIADISINGETTPVYAPEGGADQVQSDWGQVDDTAVDFIKNKPTIPEPGSEVSWNQEVQEGTKIATVTIDGNEQDVYVPEGGGGEQVQSDWSVTDSSSKAFIKNKPSIPAAQIQADWNQTNSSSKDFIKNKPTIPTTLPSSRNLLFIGDIDYREIMRATSYDDAEELSGLLDVFTFNSSNYATKTPSILYLCLPHYNDGKLLKSVSRTYNSSEGEVRYVFNTSNGSSRACTVAIPNGLTVCSIYFASTFKDDYPINMFSNYESFLNFPNQNSRRLGDCSVLDPDDSTVAIPLRNFGYTVNYTNGVRNTIMLFYEM